MQRAPGVETQHDVVGAGAQAEHGLVHHIQRKLSAGGRLAVGLARRDGVRDLLARLRLLGLRLKLHIQRDRVQRDIQRQQAHLEIGQPGNVPSCIRGGLRGGSRPPLDQHHGDVDVGHIALGDGQAVDVAVGRQADDLVAADVGALDGDQGVVRRLEGRGDEDLGGLADVVGGLVADQRDAVVVLAPPGDVILARHPDKDGGSDTPLGPPSQGGSWRRDDVVGAALRRDEGRDGFSQLVGGDGDLIHQLLLRLPRPAPAAQVVFNKGVDPLATIELDAQLLIRQALAGPIHRCEIDGALLARVAHVLLRAEADVVGAGMDDGVRPPGDGLVIRAGGGGLDGDARGVEIVLRQRLVQRCTIQRDG